MKLISSIELALPGIKVIRFARFLDCRGYFTEHFRLSDICKVIPDFKIVQCNESYSNEGTIRGLHFQWNPHMGKLIRTVEGHMVDMFLDIRLGSPTFGRLGTYSMPSQKEHEYQEWIWVPPGFAHGNIFPQDSRIEYLCTGEYSQGCEAGISPFAEDIDWSLVDKWSEQLFEYYKYSKFVTDKDKNGLTIKQWLQNPNSKEFAWKN